MSKDCLCVAVLLVVFINNVKTEASKDPSGSLDHVNMKFNDSLIENDSNIESSFEDGINFSENCNCKKGYICENINGKPTCKCPPEYGEKNNVLLGNECVPCNCGKESNCTITNTQFSSMKIKCICKEGYQDVKNFCRGPCTDNPCQNGGTCADENKTFKCVCPPGYTGKKCETENLCTKQPCKNGGICKMDGKDFNCYCTAPYSGITCEEDICTKTPCKNGGTCKLEGKSFKCDCKAPFSGNTCEEECKCENGECQKDNKENLQCVCPPLYGKYSEHNCKECDCGPGANCTFSPDIFGLTDGKKCICPFNFKESKRHCEDACTNNPCKNDGTCKPLENSFECSCKQPYFGDTCEKSPCIKNPCFNNGTCSVYQNSYKCECKSPYSGQNCEKDPCTAKSCQNGGTCTVNGTSYNCECKEPYYGKTCEKECLCKNGHCITDSEGTASCICPPEFGLYTPKSCQACECGKGANCTFALSIFSVGKKCICPFGFKESDEKCEEIDTTEADTTISDRITTDPVTTNTPGEITTNTYECYCGENSVSCRIDGSGNKLCFCEEGYDQRRGTDTCSRTCQSNADCRNDGICDRDGPSYFCLCPGTFIGDRCEVDVCNSVRFECRSRGAECVRQGTIGVCECPRGKKMSLYNYCEDICTYETCVHGTCELTDYHFSQYVCNCYEGYYGKHCENALVKPYTPAIGILVILASGIALFSITSIVAICWVKKLRKKIAENTKQTGQP